MSPAPDGSWSSTAPVPRRSRWRRSSRALERRRPASTSVVVVTGQHREMLDQVNALFGIGPDARPRPHAAAARRSAEITRARCSPARRACSRATGPTPSWSRATPRPSFAAALAAFYQQVPVVPRRGRPAHRRPARPFPEEMNRRLTAPARRAALRADATSRRQPARARAIDPADASSSPATPSSTRCWTPSQPRRRSTTRALAGARRAERPAWCWSPRTAASRGASRMAGDRPALARLAHGRSRTLHVVLPVHLNPIVREVAACRRSAALDNVVVTEPLDYGEFAHAASTGATDRPHRLRRRPGGGARASASRCWSCATPPSGPRRSRPAPSGSSAPTRTAIVAEVERLLDDADGVRRDGHAVNPYGDGHAAERSSRRSPSCSDSGTALPTSTRAMPPRRRPTAPPSCFVSERRRHDVVVVGLGYVGLPLAQEATGAGLTVGGLDIDRAPSSTGSTPGARTSTTSPTPTSPR